MTTKTPIRTCVGCRQAVLKTELLRVCLSSQGLLWDPSNTAPGRGAYLHPIPECVEKALSRGGFNRAFRISIDVAKSRMNLLSSIPPLSTRSVTGMKTR